ncbi:hypothetical protein KPH14_010176 [Odynerus spinipes]|uniref:Uncharacterized protein n=1 Tax=Odynerus spinipes TaxID=1348599 RepID=A0AAD9RT94_9HYME|nr:hypothetical protein KPH14_010176 [Odynerus spinipes]
MKYSSFRWTLLFPGLTLILGGRCACAKPLDSEDIESLLPATPQTANETVAAIVQDPVVKNAVQYAVGNGSLSGLVVKKNVVIIPANAPDRVLSHRQQILVAPTSHLEDIQKNITEDVETETEEPEEFDQSEKLAVMYQSIAEDDANEENEKSSYEVNYVTALSEDSSEDRNGTFDYLKEILPSIKPEVELPEGTVTQKINVSKIIEKAIPVPVVAVLDPSKQTNEKIESSIVALLPNQPTDQSSMNDQLDYLETNREKIRRDVQRYIDGSSLSVDPEIWKRSIVITDAENESPSTTNDSPIRNLDDVISERLTLPTIILLPREADPPYLWDSNEENYPSKDKDEDMSTAEDIVFRPLFRFRQEARRRADAYSDRRYNSYQNYDSYPRRRYRPRYNYDYS